MALRDLARPCLVERAQGRTRQLQPGPHENQMRTIAEGAWSKKLSAGEPDRLLARLTGINPHGLSSPRRSGPSEDPASPRRGFRFLTDRVWSPDNSRLAALHSIRHARIAQHQAGAAGALDVGAEMRWRRRGSARRSAPDRTAGCRGCAAPNSECSDRVRQHVAKRFMRSCIHRQRPVAREAGARAGRPRGWRPRALCALRAARRTDSARACSSAISSPATRLPGAGRRLAPLARPRPVVDRSCR